MEDPMHVYNVNPGPIDGSVLTLQDQHRSTAIWNGEDLSLNCKRSDWRRSKGQSLDERVLQLLLRAGFYGVQCIGSIRLDHALITAMVERWRVETHTFHLPIGESTITLQDVEVLLGLPVDGDPVILSDQPREIEEWRHLCEELLGFSPSLEHIHGDRLMLKCLNNRNFSSLPETADDLLILCHARRQILMLIGGMLFPENSLGEVNLRFLPLLSDLDATGRFSWGSAALAFLYRQLCRATRPEVTDIGGCLILLQLWTWERFIHMQPERVLPLVQLPLDEGHVDVEQRLPGRPLGARWKTKFKLRKVATHNLMLYRDQLDQLKDNEFLWQPYSSMIDQLPLYCIAGHEVWGTVSPLLCFNIVEWQYPDRVLRQFGIKQIIPGSSNTYIELHRISCWRGDSDFLKVRSEFILRWEKRLQHLISGDPFDGCMAFNDPYLKWYRRITRLLVGNPFHKPKIGFTGVAGSIELLARGVMSLNDLVHKAIQHYDDQSGLQCLFNIRDTAFSSLKAIGQEHRLGIHHMPDTPAPNQSSVPSPSRRHNGDASCSFDLPCNAIVTSSTSHLSSPVASQVDPLLSSVSSPVAASSIDMLSSAIAVCLPSSTVLSPSSDHLSLPASSQTDAPVSSVLASVTSPTDALLSASSIFVTGIPSQEASLTMDPLKTSISPSFEDHLHIEANSESDASQSLSMPPSKLSSSSLLVEPMRSISWPHNGILTLEWVKHLMLVFEWSSKASSPSTFNSVLPLEVLNCLVQSASKILHKEPNCVRIDKEKELGKESAVVVVGDVHGQLHDMLYILNRAGFPCDARFYVFNGNYINKGAWSLETFLLLLAWKVLMPDRVYLLRGNHESEFCAKTYGFEEEAAAKYIDEGKEVCNNCLKCFKELPLAAMIAGCTFIAHGGLFRSTTLTPSERVLGKRHKNMNATDNNFNGHALSLGSLDDLSQVRRFVQEPFNSKNMILTDVLWSNPSVDPGLSENNEIGGLGLLWGPDSTEAFLKKSNLKLIIRSHEGPDARDCRSGLKRMDQGYTIDHECESGKLITLFSAPDYPQFQASEKRYNNLAAYAVLGPPNFDEPVFCMFEAVTPRPTGRDYSNTKTKSENGKKGKEK